VSNPEIHTIRYRDLRLQVNRYDDHPGRRDLLMLHGFLGGGKQFEHLVPGLIGTVNPVTLDIFDDASPNEAGSEKNKMEPGDSDNQADLPAFHEEILVSVLQEAIRRRLNPHPIVLGYSMGGRLALSWATKHPDATAGLILESSTAGIRDPGEREKRRRDDEQKAALIREDYRSFLESWETNPLFKVTGTGRNKTNSGYEMNSESAIKQLKQIQTRHDPETMARWLTGFGSGSMSPVWDQLTNLACPVLIITGASDTKFCEIAGELESRIRNSFHITIPDAAHRVHIDTPEQYLSHVCSFVKSISD